VAASFLDQLDAGGQAEFGVDVGEVRLHGATAAANRDPAVYDHPQCLDIREGPQAMLTFGGGVHYCLGTHLARLELAEALKVITRRMPNPRLAGAIPWKQIAGVSGPITVPIEFDAGH
jgi:cytochrome P450